MLNKLKRLFRRDKQIVLASMRTPTFPEVAGAAEAHFKSGMHHIVRHVMYAHAAKLADKEAVVVYRFIHELDDELSRLWTTKENKVDE